MDDHLITLQIRFIAPPDEWVVIVVCSSDICKICPLQHFPWVFKMKWPRSSNAWPHACLVVSRVRYLLAMVILLQFVVSFLASRLTFPCPKLWRYLSEPPRSDATKAVYVCGAGIHCSIPEFDLPQKSPKIPKSSTNVVLISIKAACSIGVKLHRYAAMDGRSSWNFAWKAQQCTMSYLSKGDGWAG